MEIYAISLIIALFVVTTLIKPGLDKLLPFKFCSICFAVSATWLTLLVLGYLSIEVDPVLPAVLMGGSVVGTMYKIKESMKSKNYNGSSIVQVIFMCFGFLIIYYFLQNNGTALVLTTTTGVFAGVLLWILLKRSDAPGGTLKKNDPLYKVLGKKLENCCD
ncbi:MAG: hypothetical protein ACE5DX_04075 [Candidatus Dojkabacteria bacterium]